MAKQPKGHAWEHRAAAKSAESRPAVKQSAYPSTRYLQVHFEFIQTMINELRGELRQINCRLDRMEERLDHHRGERPVRHRKWAKEGVEMPQAPTRNHGG